MAESKRFFYLTGERRKKCIENGGMVINGVYQFDNTGCLEAQTAMDADKIATILVNYYGVKRFDERIKVEAKPDGDK